MNNTKENRVAKKVNAAKSKTRAVLVTTEYRGVFYGQSDCDLSATEVTLTGARNCLHWDAKTGGFLGLAEKGPTSGCKIGMKVTGPLVLQKVTCVATVSAEAASAWEAAPCVS